MEHAIALAYLISCLLLAASFPIVLIRKNQNGTEDVFFAHIQGFLLLLLLALLFNMMLHYYQTVFAPAQRDTPLMLCNLLCDLCVFFWIEMQRCVVTSRLGSMVRKLCRLYLITYLSVWILANTPQLPDKIVLCYLGCSCCCFCCSMSSPRDLNSFGENPPINYFCCTASRSACCCSQITRAICFIPAERPRTRT